MLLKRAASAGTKMMCDVLGKPVARLLLETLIGPPTIVPHRFLERCLDVDERQMIEQIPNNDAAKLPNRDAPATKLVLGPQRGAVHVEQRTIEVEEGGGAAVQVFHHGYGFEALTEAEGGRQWFAGSCA